MEKLQSLTEAENLVHEYIRNEAQQSGGSLMKSYKDLAEDLSKAYANQIHVFKRKKTINGVQESDKSISTATVSRALKKLVAEGIVTVRAPRQKDKPNEIIYLGVPNAEQQVGDILQMAKNLSLSLNRFEMILAKKDKQIRELQSDNDNLYKENDDLKEQIAQLAATNRHLEELLETVQTEHNPFEGGKLLSVTDIGDGQVAYVVQR